MPAKKDPCSELSKVITQLAMNIGEMPGMNTLDDVLVELQKHIPEISRSVLVQSIVEATTGHQQILDDVAKRVAALKREARTDAAMQKRIADLEAHVKAGLSPKPAPRPRKASPEAIARLQRRRDELAKALRRNDPESRKKVQEEIAELEKHLAAGTAPAEKPKAGPETPPDLKALREQRDKLKAAVRDASPKRKTLLEKRIGELEEAIATGKHPRRTPRKATPPEIAELQRRRDELANRLKRSSPERIDKWRQKIDELADNIEAGTLPEPKPRKPAAAEDPAVAALRDIRDRLRKELGKSEPAIRKRLAEQIDALAERLEDVSGVPPIKPAETRASKDIERLEYERNKLRKQVRIKIESMRPKSFWRKSLERAVYEPLNLARATLTSFDLSAVLRQGGFIALGNPARAAKTFGPMFKAFASDQYAEKVAAEISDRPNAPIADRAKLYIAPLDGAINKQEEAFMSRLAGKLPGVANSQRAYVTFLNKLRADSFDAMLETLSLTGDPTLEEAKAIANYINVATGRGSLGKFENSAEGLATVFFSPRLVASRFQLLASPLTGFSMHGGSARTRKAIGKEYARFLTGLAVVYALGALAGGEIEKDPRSSDFGKIKFGNTRLDPMTGLSQVTVLLARLASGETKSISGKVKPIRGDIPYGGDKASDVAWRFAKSKASPPVGAVLNILDGENFIGEDVTFASTVVDMTVPMSFQDTLDVMQEHGVAKGTAISILGLFGMSVQHHEKK